MIPQLQICQNVVDHCLEKLTEVLRASDPMQLHHVVLTGGSAGGSITEALADVARNVSGQTWTNTHFWWGDERFVESGSVDRNDLDIERHLGEYFFMSNIHRIPAADYVSDAQESAKEYARELLVYGLDGLPPRFSLVFLGVGPDGHVASLFPGKSDLNSLAIAMPVMDSPKPPPVRITLGYPTLNNSDCTLLLLGGQSKQKALEAVMDDHGCIDETPARGIRATKLYALTEHSVTV